MPSQTTHHQKITEALYSLKNKEYIDKKEWRDFDEFLKNPHILRAENVLKHCCAACFIIHPKEKKIFLGDHIRAGRWLNGVGGHIELDESPEEAARREFKEEVSYEPPRNFQLFDIVHFHNVGRPTCSDHFDFLYLTLFEDLPNFNYDKNEFKEARWLSFDDALQVYMFPVFKKKLITVFQYISS